MITPIVSYGLFLLLIVLLIIAGGFTKKPKKNIILACVLIGSIYALFIFTRPYIIQYKVNQRVAKLETHLTGIYPEEQWTIYVGGEKISKTTKKYKSEFDPREMVVIFENEPDVSYIYMDYGEIEQKAYSTPENMDSVKHRE